MLTVRDYIAAFTFAVFWTAIILVASVGLVLGTAVAVFRIAA